MDVSLEETKEQRSKQWAEAATLQGITKNVVLCGTCTHFFREMETELILQSWCMFHLSFCESGIYFLHLQVPKWMSFEHIQCSSDFLSQETPFCFNFFILWFLCAPWNEGMCWQQSQNNHLNAQLFWWQIVPCRRSPVVLHVSWVFQK